MASEKLKELEELIAAAADGADRIDALNALAWELRERDTVRAHQLAQRALELAAVQEAKGYTYLRGKAQALITLGELANNSNAYGLALTYLLEVYSLLQGHLFPDLLAVALHSIGWAHYRLENYDEAVDFLNRALQFVQESGDPVREAEVLTSLGTVYKARVDHAQAMDYFQRALLLQENQAVGRGKGVTLNNLAYAQIMLGETDEAVRNALAGIQIFHDLGLISPEGSVLDTLGKAYFARGEFDQAEEILQRCLSIARETSSEHLEMESMLNLGRVYFQRGLLDQAGKFFEQALTIAETRQLNIYKYKYHEMLAKIYEQQGALKDALQHYKGLHSAMELAQAEAANYRMDNLKILHQVEKTRKEAEVLWLNNRALEREIDERLRERVELEKLATTDPLTGLYNRKHFFTLGEYEFEKARENETPLSLIMLDIDHFKLVNDQFGHATGDQALIEVARLLSGNARKGDVCCRYGGEEFILLLPNTELVRGQEVAERVRQVVAATSFQIASDDIRITASLGVAQADRTDSDLIAVLARADQALYRAKAVGRNQIST
jgi:diguanylate cyclase (GGDEF)-like protein